MTADKIRLGDIRRNDYNPRTAPARHGGEVDIDTESLSDSIEDVGLDNALTVRPLDDGSYEVVTGDRRFLALQERYDDDYEVKVDIEDLSYEQAKRRCFAENAEREDLSVMQQTWGWAEAVTVEADGEEMTYAEYVEKIRPNKATIGLQVPGKGNSDVKAIVESSSVSGSKVIEWLSFLLLPQRARKWVNTDDLPKRAARMIVRRVRNGKSGGYYGIDDTSAALEMMGELADKYGDPEGEYANGIRGGDYENLQRDIESRVEDYHRRKAIAQEETEEFAELLAERTQALVDAIGVADTEYNVLEQGERPVVDETTNPDDIPVESVLGTCDVTRDRLEERKNKLSDKGHKKEIEAREVEGEKKKVQKALSKYDEDEGRCEFCHQPVDPDDLRGITKSLTERIETLRDESSEASAKASKIRDIRGDLLTKRNNVEGAQESYDDALETAQEFADEVVAQ